MGKTPATGVMCDACGKQAARWYRDTAVPICLDAVCATTEDAAFEQHAKQVRERIEQEELNG